MEELSEFDNFFKTSETQCWQTKSGNINLYLFSQIYETVSGLQQHYKELRDHVAISFQSRILDKPAERWNLYLLFLVKEEVPEEVKQAILQDKFSTRKMVCSIGKEEADDAYINALVGKTLIDIEIPKRETSTDQLHQLISDRHPQVAAAIKIFGLINSRDNLENLIKILADEQN